VRVPPSEEKEDKGEGREEKAVIEAKDTLTLLNYKRCPHSGLVEASGGGGEGGKEKGEKKEEKGHHLEFLWRFLACLLSDWDVGGREERKETRKTIKISRISFRRRKRGGRKEKKGEAPSFSVIKPPYVPVDQKKEKRQSPSSALACKTLCFRWRGKKKKRRSTTWRTGLCIEFSPTPRTQEGGGEKEGRAAVARASFVGGWKKKRGREEKGATSSPASPAFSPSCARAEAMTRGKEKGTARLTLRGVS